MRRDGGAWGGRAVGSALLSLLALRALTVFVPSMWVWGLNHQRFLPPLIGLPRSQFHSSGSGSYGGAPPFLCFVPVLLFVRPAQGIFRDLETFAVAGVAGALAAARVIGVALRDERVPARLAPGLLALVLLSALQALVLFNDPESGLRRARSYASEAPRCDQSELAQIWDGIAYVAFRLPDWPTAVEVSAHAARYAPHPRALAMLALARTYAGGDPLVWLGLGGAALRLGDSVRTARALARLESYALDSREAALIRRHLRMFPEVWPTGVVRRGGEDRTREEER